ncbi:MAG TPA: dihydrofolate synthase, partial [Pseudonocardiaceae bacterium]|nr:dihydrofolate synthase [Pseudonocardiaceae bacterium]
RRLVAVVGVMGDKDAHGILSALEPVVAEAVLTANSSPRAMPADDLAAVALDVFGADRIVVEPKLADAIETAIGLAEEVGEPGQPLSGAGVVVTGSVVTAGEARALFGKEPA